MTIVIDDNSTTNAKQKSQRQSRDFRRVKNMNMVIALSAAKLMRACVGIN